MYLVTVPWLMQDFLAVNMDKAVVLGVTVTSHHQTLHHIQIPDLEDPIHISVVLTMEYHHPLTTVGPEIIKEVVHEVVAVVTVIVVEEVDIKIVIGEAEVAVTAAEAAILQDLDTLLVVLQVIMVLEVAEATKAKEVDKPFIILIGAVVGAVNRPHRILRVEAGTPAVVKAEVRVMAQEDTRHLTHLPQGEVVQDIVEIAVVVVELDEMALVQALGVTEAEPHEMMVTTLLTIIIADVNYFLKFKLSVQQTTGKNYS